MTIPCQRSGIPLGRAGRCLLGFWGLILACGFALALALEPDPRGYGTHQRLGLPPCTVRLAFQIPCPTCGMTTSVAHFVRGRFAESARANVAGFALAAACAAQIPWAWFGAWKGRLWRVSRPEALLGWLLAAWTALAALQWGVRLWLG